MHFNTKSCKSCYFQFPGKGGREKIVPNPHFHKSLQLVDRGEIIFRVVIGTISSLSPWIMKLVEVSFIILQIILHRCKHCW